MRAYLRSADQPRLAVQFQNPATSKPYGYLMVVKVAS